MSTNHTLRISPDSKTFAAAQASDYPLAYALATHAGSGILRRDKSLQWQDAIQCAATALIESGHDPCKPLNPDGLIAIPVGLVSAVKRQLQAMASPVNGLTRGKDSHESAERKKTRDRLTSAAKRLRSNPMAVARKAIEHNLFPTLNAFDIYRRLEDLKSLTGHDWRKAVTYAMPKISAKGLTHLAEAPGTSPIRSVICGFKVNALGRQITGCSDGRGTVAYSDSGWDGKGCGIGLPIRKSFPVNNFTPIRILATRDGLRVFRDELDFTSLPAY